MPRATPRCSSIDSAGLCVQNTEPYSQKRSPRREAVDLPGSSPAAEKADSVSTRKGSAAAGHRSVIHQETTMRERLHDGGRALAGAGAWPLRKVAVAVAV